MCITGCDSPHEEENDSTFLDFNTNREVCQLLMTVVGETGENEGAVDVVQRLIEDSRARTKEIIEDKNVTKVSIFCYNEPEGVDGSTMVITIPKDEAQFNHWREHVESFRLKVIDEQEKAE